MKKLLLIAGGLLATFLVGYVPQYLNVGRLSEELEEATNRHDAALLEREERLAILELQRDLGSLLLEVENQNYGRARERSTRWFDRLADASALSSTQERRRALAALSQRRDALTALLTEGNSDAVTQVRQMYAALADVTEPD